VIFLEPPQTGGLHRLGYTAALWALEQTLKDPSQSLGASIRSLASAAGVTEEDPTVLCVGRDEMRLFSRRAVERWEQEYGIVNRGYSLDSVENPLVRDQRPVREARARGAACILRFGGLSNATT
jgi:hypothetical protein